MAKSIQRTLTRLKSKLCTNKKTTIDVGLFEGSRYPDGESIPEVGYFNVYGTDTIPARNFFEPLKTSVDIRRTVQHFAGEYMKTLIILSGKDARGSLVKIGLQGEQALKNSITELQDPPNAPSTIRRKKSSNPLIDTGLMRASISHKIGEE